MKICRICGYEHTGAGAPPQICPNCGSGSTWSDHAAVKPTEKKAKTIHKICPACGYEHIGQDDITTCPRCGKEMKHVAEKVRAISKEKPSKMYFPFVTLLIIAANVIIFLETSLPEATINNFGMYQGAIGDAFYAFYRIFTSAFIHFSFMHLIRNMFLFLILGLFLETQIGSLKFSAIYLTGMIGSGLFINFFASAGSIHAGASGAVLAVMAASLVLTLTCKVWFPIRWLLVNVGANIANSFAPDISWQGHLGGAIAGVLTAFLYVLISHLITVSKRRKANMNPAAGAGVQTVTMPVCPYCGTVLETGVKQCPGCGGICEDGGKKKKGKKTVIIVIAAVAATFVTAAVLALVLSTQTDRFGIESNQAVTVNPGVVRDGVYINKTFGLRFAVPEDWTAQTYMYDSVSYEEEMLADGYVADFVSASEDDMRGFRTSVYYAEGIEDFVEREGKRACLKWQLDALTEGGFEGGIKDVRFLGKTQSAVLVCKDGIYIVEIFIYKGDYYCGVMTVAPTAEEAIAILAKVKKP